MELVLIFLFTISIVLWMLGEELFRDGQKVIGWISFIASAIVASFFFIIASTYGQDI